MLKHRTNSSYTKLKAILCLLFFAGLCTFFPLKALALNSDYVSIDRWKQQENLQSVNIEYESIGNTLTGSFSFFTDDSLGIYTMFQISETSLKKSANKVFVTYKFNMDGETYSVIVGKDGMSDETQAEEKKLFSVINNFNELGTYISAAQYTGKSYTECSVDIVLQINGHNYKITENKSLYGEPIEMEITTTTKPETTKLTTAKITTTKLTTTRATTKSSVTKAKKKKEKTTKFKPKYNITTTAKASAAQAEPEEQETERQTAQVEATAEDSTALMPSTGSGSEIKGETRMSRSAMIYLILGIIIATAGITMIVTASLIKNKKE